MTAAHALRPGTKRGLFGRVELSQWSDQNSAVDGVLDGTGVSHAHRILRYLRYLRMNECLMFCVLCIDPSFHPFLDILLVRRCVSMHLHGYMRDTTRKRRRMRVIPRDRETQLCAGLVQHGDAERPNETCACILSLRLLRFVWAKLSERV